MIKLRNSSFGSTEEGDVSPSYKNEQAVQPTGDLEKAKASLHRSGEAFNQLFACPYPVPLGPEGTLQIVDEVTALSAGFLLNNSDSILECLRPLLRKRKSSEGKEAVTERAMKKPRASLIDDICTSLAYKSAGELNEWLIPRRSRQVASPGESPAKRPSISSQVDLNEYQAVLWEKRFQELLEFRGRHDNCLVPHNWAENLALAKWVKRQRYQFKLKTEGKHSTLTEERQSALDNLGFIWDSHNAVWEERLSELMEFKRRHGHCNVPSTYSDNHSLSVWVQCQRRQYKLFREKDNWSGMSEERISRLESIGFVWKLK
jgi:hypothetical protein